MDSGFRPSAGPGMTRLYFGSLARSLNATAAAAGRGSRAASCPHSRAGTRRAAAAAARPARRNPRSPDGSTSIIRLKPSAAPFAMPGLDHVGDLLGRADHLPVAAAVAVEHLAHGQLLLLRQPHGGVAEAARAAEVAVRPRSVRPASARRASRSSTFTPTRSASFFSSACPPQFVELVLARAGFRLGAAEHRQQARQDADGVGIAAVGLRPAGARRRGTRSRASIGVLRGEDDVGEAGGELAPRLRRAGLEQHRPSLRRARQRQRTRGPSSARRCD